MILTPTRPGFEYRCEWIEEFADEHGSPITRCTCNGTGEVRTIRASAQEIVDRGAANITGPVPRYTPRSEERDRYKLRGYPGVRYRADEDEDKDEDADKRKAATTDDLLKAEKDILKATNQGNVLLDGINSTVKVMSIVSITSGFLLLLVFMVIWSNRHRSSK